MKCLCVHVCAIVFPVMHTHLRPLAASSSLFLTSKCFAILPALSSTLRKCNLASSLWCLTSSFTCSRTCTLVITGKENNLEACTGRTNLSHLTTILALGADCTRCSSITSSSILCLTTRWSTERFKCVVHLFFSTRIKFDYWFTSTMLVSHSTVRIALNDGTCGSFNKRLVLSVTSVTFVRSIATGLGVVVIR